MNRDDGSAVLVLVSRFPSLLLHLGFSYLKGKRKVKRAGREFHRQLIINGVSPDNAKRLTEVYTSQFSFRKLVNEAGLGRMFKRS
ncbi:MAG: hypothetical protein ACLFUV_04880 [Methanomassiliicoccales archaeon]